jgi:hypothetical protein
MSRGWSSLLTPLVILVWLLAAADSAAADTVEQLRIVNLRVRGGESNWHADNDFRLDWDDPAVAVAGFEFRVRNSAGNVVIPETDLSWDARLAEYIHLPSGPGRYTAEVWADGNQGEKGPPEKATLLYDDSQPSSVQPLAASGWIAAGTPAIVRVSHPSAPQPLAGIRGYAVSVGRGGGEPPCSGPDRCAEAETDLLGGIGGDTLSLGLLPEGTNVVRAVAVSNSGVRSAEIGSATVRVDATMPTVTLRGAPQGWSPEPVRVTATATDALSGMVARGPTGPFTAISVDGGVPTVSDGDSVTTTVNGDGSHRVAFYARDSAGNVIDDSEQEKAATETVRIDSIAPQVAFARSQDPGEPERIEATVADSLSGADPQRGAIAVRQLGSRQAFEPLPTTVSGDRLIAHWDSDSFPAGDYEFRATGYDVAGNAGIGERRSDGAKLVLANPLKMTTSLQSGFGSRQLFWQRCSGSTGKRRCRRQVTKPFESRPTTRLVPFGHGALFGGRLTSTAGAPIARAPIQVIESFDSAALAPRTTTVETGADGTFSVHLGPGPSRQIEAVFAGNRVLTRASDGAVRLGVLAGIHFHASATAAKIGGAPIVFGGRLAGSSASMPPGNRSLELQFRLPGAPWAEFRTVQTDAHGRFRYPYTFSDDDSRGVRFQFRANVPKQEDWPYEPAASRPVFVTGH